MRILLAGATGSVGFEFLKLAKSRGHQIVTLSRSRENARKLEGLATEIQVQDATRDTPSLDGIELVVSALGGPVTVSHPEKRSYRKIDFEANAKLLAAAQKSKVKRFVYVSVHVENGYRDTAYIRAHEDFVKLLQQSGLSYSIIRPTGIFSAFHDFVGFAHKGMATAIGGGNARTNPVHQTDVAHVLLQNLESGPPEISVGGPDILTRQQIAEMPFEILGKSPRILHLPPGLFRLGSKLVGVLNPRLGELFEFVTAASLTDCIAPSLGNRRLEDYFREIAG